MSKDFHESHAMPVYATTFAPQPIAGLLAQPMGWMRSKFSSMELKWILTGPRVVRQ